MNTFAHQTALLIVHAASLNPESKGCHFIDIPSA